MTSSKLTPTQQKATPRTKLPLPPQAVTEILTKGKRMHAQDPEYQVAFDLMGAAFQLARTVGHRDAQVVDNLGGFCAPYRNGLKTPDGELFAYLCDTIKSFLPDIEQVMQIKREIDQRTILQAAERAAARAERETEHQRMMERKSELASNDPQAFDKAVKEEVRRQIQEVIAKAEQTDDSAA